MSQPGRKIVCSFCTLKTVKGTTRVCRRVVFQFCSDCWLNDNGACTAFMTKVSEVPASQQKKAA